MVKMFSICFPAVFLGLFSGNAQVRVPQLPTQPRQPEALSRKRVTGTLEESRKIVSPNGIETLSAVPINGTMQWLSVRGRDRRNPMLLMLHGGPGSPTMPEDYTFQSPWEDYFTVVEWDQRGAGKTYAANDPNIVAPTMTLEQMSSDAEEVVRYLQKTYSKKKIILMGHSWGSVLGVRLAQAHPEWFYAYVGVGQIVNMRKSEKIGYDFVLAQAKELHNEEAVKQLEALAPYPGDVGGFTIARGEAQRKWLMYYGGLTYGRTNYKYNADAWKLSPDYTEKDLDQIDAGSLLSLQRRRWRKWTSSPLERSDVRSFCSSAGMTTRRRMNWRRHGSRKLVPPRKSSSGLKTRLTWSCRRNQADFCFILLPMCDL